MKRIIKIMPVFCVLFVALLFAGCSIEAPTVTVNGCLVSWNWVPNATSYEIEVNGKSYTTTENNYNLAPLIQKSSIPQDVRVKAITKNIFLINSAYSDVVTVAVGNTKLPAPQNFKIEITEQSYLCSWDSVDNADYYCVRLYNSEKNIEQFYSTQSRSCNLYGKLDVAGKYVASVFAYSNKQAHTYAPSEYSNSAEFMMDVTLDAPTELTIKSVSGNLYCEWRTINGADSYNVSVLNGETFNVKNDSSSQIQVLNLTDKGVTVGKGEAIFVCVGALGAENSGYTESPYTDMYAYFDGTGTKNDFATVKYNFVGQEFDLVADSYDELQSIAWFTMYYRITNMRFFFNYKIVNTSAALDFKQCIQDYQEIKHVSYSLTSNSDGSYVSSMEYIHPMYPTKTASNTSSQNQFVRPNSYTRTPRVDSFDNFGIDSRTETAMVYNSDQLYYAVQNGCKPVFPDDNNPAYVAYIEAKRILRGIVSDDMTDYAKVLAIFDWLCFTTHYDHELPNIDAKIKTGELSGNSSDYRGFYIEGVFFDQGQAVCDGMSKAFALLCGVENIDCYKVVGVSNTDSNSTNIPDHAWNKVKLDLVGNDGVGEWYVVDVTQNDFYDSTYVEILSHSFFLHTDDWATETRKHKEIYPKKDIACTAFDYYEATKYDGTNSILIKNSAELKALATYTKSNLSYIEFALDTASYSSYNIPTVRGLFQKGLSATNFVPPRVIYNETGVEYLIFVVYYNV